MKKNNKKGISPLIATVIVIGFTIVLAALVITWGTRLFKTTVSDTETASKFNLACTTGMKLDITKKTGGTINSIPFSMVNNNQDQPIDGFKAIIRCKNTNIIQSTVTPVPSTVATQQLTFPLPKAYNVAYAYVVSTTSPVPATACSSTGADSIDFYPQLTIEGQTRSCESPINVKV